MNDLHEGTQKQFESETHDLIRFSECESNEKSPSIKDLVKEFDPLSDTLTDWTKFGEDDASAPNTPTDGLNSSANGSAPFGSLRNRPSARAYQNRVGGVFDKEVVWDELKDLSKPVSSAKTIVTCHSTPQLGLNLSDPLPVRGYTPQTLQVINNLSLLPFFMLQICILAWAVF